MTSSRSSMLLPSEAVADLENALAILRRNTDALGEIGYGDAQDEIESAMGHVAVAIRFLSAEEEE